MAHQHNKDCEDLRAARDSLRAQLRPPREVTERWGAAYGQNVQLEPVATPDVEKELASVDQALRDAGCDG